MKSKFSKLSVGMVALATLLTACGNQANTDNMPKPGDATTTMTTMPMTAETTVAPLLDEERPSVLVMSPFGDKAISQGITGKKVEAFFNLIASETFCYEYVFSTIEEGMPVVTHYQAYLQDGEMAINSVRSGKEERILIFKDKSGAILDPISKTAWKLSQTDLAKRMLAGTMYKHIAQAATKLELTGEGTEAFFEQPASYEEYTSNFKDFVRYYFNSEGKLLGHVTAEKETPNKQQVVKVKKLDATLPTQVSFEIPSEYKIASLPAEAIDTTTVPETTVPETTVAP